MGIFCEINLHKAVDGAFVPGETVSGSIRYAVDEDFTVTRTIVSLKGSGYLEVEEQRDRSDEEDSKCIDTEKYVDIDHVLHEDVKGSAIPYGQYEDNFSFKLPEDIPPSFNYYEIIPRYTVRCRISYYVRIKFERPGMFQRNKHFRKEITVISGVKPRLPTSPTVFGEQKKLFQPFTLKPSIVSIKANVESCVVQPGGKIELNYEIFNDTNVTIKAVETKLKEVYAFKRTAHMDVDVDKDVPHTETKTSLIQKGETQSMLIVINLPSSVSSVENSKIMSRDYIVKITAALPMPHFNATLEIPVQIGNVYCNVPENGDPPPTYWEAMGEHEEKDEKA